MFEPKYWCSLCSEPTKALWRITSEHQEKIGIKESYLCKLHAINMEKFMLKEMKRKDKKRV